MTRRQRNALIESNYPSYTQFRPIFIAISGYIGDSEEVDLDWSDLSEATGINDLYELEDYLDEMASVGIIEVDYEQSIIG